MDWRKQVFRIQVDVTSYCNAKCGGCSRNVMGGEKVDWLPLDHIDKDVWKRVFEQDTKDWYIAELKLNGSWGDPGMHPHLPEMMDIFVRSHPEAGVRICTNGGTHNEKWWADLGEALSQNSGYHTVDFAIDGLSDTHHLYRRSTSFEKVIANAKALSQAGGYARWIMTLFDYNMHQLDAARDYAGECGFKEWVPRRSNLKNGLIETPDETYRLWTDESDKIPVPEGVWFDEEDVAFSQEIHKRINNLKSKSACPWYSKGIVQIDPWSKVWPCCHLADASTGYDLLEQRALIADSLPKDEKDFNDLNKNSLEYILSHSWYNATLRDAVEHGKWPVCRDECGIFESGQAEWIERNY
jgi:sulfatase maturation enzyme AslB (radical SAM superfamily)